MLEFMHGVVDDIWETQAPHEGFVSPTKGKESFKKLYPPTQGDIFEDLVTASPNDLTLTSLSG